MVLHSVDIKKRSNTANVGFLITLDHVNLYPIIFKINKDEI